MMKKGFSVFSLALLLSLALCACGGPNDNEPPENAQGDPEGVWSQVTDANWSSQDYGGGKGPEAIPADWTLPQDLDLGENPRIEVSGDLLLYGPSYETAMPEGFTVARYEDGKLTPVYTFDEGLTVTWHQFFSPDGKHIVFPWKVQDDQPGGMKIRVVDLTTGVEEDLELPKWEKETDTLFVKWHDDTTLQVSAMSAGGEDWAHWVYAFPMEKGA